MTGEPPGNLRGTSGDLRGTSGDLRGTSGDLRGTSGEPPKPPGNLRGTSGEPPGNLRGTSGERKFRKNEKSTEIKIFAVVLILQSFGRLYWCFCVFGRLSGVKVRHWLIFGRLAGWQTQQCRDTRVPRFTGVARGPEHSCETRKSA